MRTPAAASETVSPMSISSSRWQKPQKSVSMYGHAAAIPTVNAPADATAPKPTAIATTEAQIAFLRKVTGLMCFVYAYVSIVFAYTYSRSGAELTRQSSPMCTAYAHLSIRFTAVGEIRCATSGRSALLSSVSTPRV